VSGLRGALAEGRPVVTAEIGPPRGADPDAVPNKAKALLGWVDAVNITDNAGATARQSSLAGSVLALLAGVEPVMQLTCRDRNRLALQSDLLAAGALGIPNVLLMTGDDPGAGDHPEAKPVFDLDGLTLTRVARTLRDEGTLMSGVPLAGRPDWLVGAVENPFADTPELRAARLATKVEAGAEFAQTQFVFDLARFRQWMDAVAGSGVSARCAVLAGVGPIRSLRMLEFLRSGLAGVHVPDDVERRLRGVPGDRVAEEGVRMCVETVRGVLEIPGVAGIHLMALGHERGLPELLERAGLGPDQRLSRPTDPGRDGAGRAP
jgi:methylenetetrahydrofolate reductase (NADPH)